MLNEQPASLVQDAFRTRYVQRRGHIMHRTQGLHQAPRKLLQIRSVGGTYRLRRRAFKLCPDRPSTIGAQASRLTKCLRYNSGGAGDNN